MTMRVLLTALVVLVLLLALVGCIGYFVDLLLEDKVARGYRETGVPMNAALEPAQPTQPVPVRAPIPDQFCMNYPCNSPWTNDRHGWRTCDDHRTPTMPACKVCKRADATEFGRLCTECHVRIRDHFDEFVDQSLAIANSEPDPADEVGQADLAMWEIESGRQVS